MRHVTPEEVLPAVDSTDELKIKPKQLPVSVQKLRPTHLLRQSMQVGGMLYGRLVVNY